MSLSAGQLFAISATERTCSTISLTATSIIIISFLSSPSFRKPINRLVFYASFGNIMANVATLISQSGIGAGTSSNLCQMQAFLIQWFVFIVEVQNHALLGRLTVLTSSGLCPPTPYGLSPWRSTSISPSFGNITQSNCDAWSGSTLYYVMAYHSYLHLHISL